MEGQEGTQQPQLVLAHKLFRLTNPHVLGTEKVRLREEVLATIKSEGMVTLYKTLAGESLLERDQSFLDSMLAKNDEELQKLEEKIAAAEENLGESEVREAHLAKSLFYIRIGDKEKSLEQLKVTESKTVGVDQKMDLVFYTLQIGFFYLDFDLISKSIDRAKNLFEEGGDRERKNRLKVYEGLYCMSTRNFKVAANLFLDSVSTFTARELFPYDKFIFYTVLASIVSLDRVSLRKVLDAPEILTVAEKTPSVVAVLLNSLYKRRYQAVFRAFADLLEQSKLDRYLHPHFRYYHGRDAALSIIREWDPMSYVLRLHRLSAKADGILIVRPEPYLNPPLPTFARVPAPILNWAQKNIRPPNERPHRPISLILEGPSRTGKTYWACSLGRHNYYSGYLGMAHHDNEAFYNVIDNINPSDLKYWKEFLGAKREWYAQCKYERPKKIAGGIPSIVLCNPGRGWSYKEYLDSSTKVELKKWTEQNAIFLSIQSSLF